MKKNIYTFFILGLTCIISNNAMALNGEPVKAHIKTQLIPAIQAKEQKWITSFSKLSEAEGLQLEAMGALDDIRAKQVEMTKQATIENPPDIDGSLHKGIAGAVLWNNANNQTEGFTGFLLDINANKMSKIESVNDSVNDFIDRISDKILDEVNDGDITSPLTNAAVLFKPKAYAGDDVNGLEQELLDAIDFNQIVIAPYNEESVSYGSFLTSNRSNARKMDSLSKEARESLAFMVMNQPLVMRTKVEDGGLGRFAKEYMQSLNEKTGKQWFSESVINDIPNDISKYEFMDFLFSYIPMNPAWHISLDGMTPKALQRTQVELQAFLSILNWENSKMLEKLIGLSAADLATIVD